MRYVMISLCMLFLLMANKNKEKEKACVVISAIILLLFVTFREYIFPAEQIGNDYYSYKNWFYNIQNIKISIENDILFNILMLLINKITGEYLVFIFIVSLLWVVSIYKFSVDNSKNYVFTIFIFICFGILELGLSAIRQAMAISVFLLCFKYIGQRNSKKYVIGILIASLFHSSAIALLLIYPFVNIRLSITKKVLLLIMVAIVMTVLIKNGVYESVLQKYVNNYSVKYENIGSELNSNYTVLGVSFLTLFMINALSYSRDSLVNTNNPIYMYLLLLCLSAYVATMHPTFGRMLQYFMPAVPLAIPSSLFYGKKTDVIKVANVAVVMLFLVMYIV